MNAAIELDDESVFIDRYKNGINTSFVVFQIAVYLGALLLLKRRERHPAGAGAAVGRGLEAAGLGIVAFPVATFLAGVLPAHRIGLAGYITVIIAIDAAAVTGAWLASRRSLDRLMILTGGTLVVMAVDLVAGSFLQMNTIFGYSPIVAGRFSGVGNIAFSVIAATTVITAALVVHRWGSDRRTLTLVALLFAAVVVVDGMPQFGSDVGGVLALVPGFAIAWMLLAGIRPSVRTLVLAAMGAVVALGVFLAVDLSRPPDARTHLGRLFEDVTARGSRRCGTRSPVRRRRT